MGPQHVFDILPVKARLRYDDQCVAALRGDGVQPASFGDRIIWVPLRLDMNRTDDYVTGAVSLIILGQIVVTDLSVVAVAKRDTGMVAQPGVVILGQVP